MAGYGASQRRELGLLGCVVEGVALERLHKTLCESKRPDERPWPIAGRRTRGRAGPDENVYRQDAVRLWIARFVCARMRERTRRLHVGRDTPVRKVRRRCVRSSEHRFRGLSREMQGDWCDAKNWDTKLDGRSFVYVVRGSWSWGRVKYREWLPASCMPDLLMRRSRLAPILSFSRGYLSRPLA